jgi:hypothetical protein
MTFARPDKKSDTVDEGNRLFCSVAGCTNLWTVQIDRPMCSHHQWNRGPIKPKIGKLPDLKAKTVSQWYDEDEF